MDVGDKVLTLGMFVSLLALGELEKWTLFPQFFILQEFLITGLRLVAAGGKKLQLKNRESNRAPTCLHQFTVNHSLINDFQSFSDYSWYDNLVHLCIFWNITLSLPLSSLFIQESFTHKYWQFFIDQKS